MWRVHSDRTVGLTLMLLGACALALAIPFMIFVLADEAFLSWQLSRAPPASFNEFAARQQIMIGVAKGYVPYLIPFGGAWLFCGWRASKGAGWARHVAQLNCLAAIVWLVLYGIESAKLSPQVLSRASSPTEQAIQDIFVAIGPVVGIVVGSAFLLGIGWFVRAGGRPAAPETVALPNGSP